jgi:thiol-disulfide isomerase/thioredoxin
VIKEYNGTNLIKDGLLYFYSSWISSCNMYNELVSNIDKKFKDLSIMKINTTKHYELKEKFKITKIPSFIMIKDDEIISRKDGNTNQYTIINWINENRG